MKTLLVFGTRPEAIKMAPLIRALSADARFTVEVCVSAQHRAMLDQVLAFFEITPDYDLDLMTPGQTLGALTARALTGVGEVIEQAQPDLVLVQGDTTTTMTGALAAYYAQIPVAHIEAGLRSGDLYAPFPEEGNRALVGRLAAHHFAPTERAAANLRREGVETGVSVVGNTGIDALFAGLEILRSRGEDEVEREMAARFAGVDLTRRIVLITGHRRESFGGPFRELCSAIRSVAERFSDDEFVYPVHLNPNVQAPVREILGDAPNIHLIDPLPYPEMIWLMDRCHMLITDSGGLQEEAPSLGKPLLVTRAVTERQEGVEAGAAKLVGSDFEKITAEATRLLTDEAAYQAMSNVRNPYGDGQASARIRDLLMERR